MYKPIVLVILDGYGRGLENAANAIFKAKKPNIDFIEKNFRVTNLQASGIAVGLPWGEEGNSEVGHLNLGSGRIVYQYLTRITFAIRDGSFLQNQELLLTAQHVKKNNSALHIMGLLGQGNVHSYIDHLYAILDFAKNLTDEFIEPKIIESEPIKDNDAVIFINFREDSVRQLTESFVLENFDKFKRKQINNLYFATMTRYDKDLPLHVLFEPLNIDNPLVKIISDAGKFQMHIAETEKYAHITYFFNGGIEASFPNEDRLLVPTQHDYNFAENPAMSAPEITKKVIESIESKKYDFIVINYANADMIGHTGDFKATVKAIEIIDDKIGQIMEAVLKIGGILIITADHGNADEKIDLLTGTPLTEHSANSIPFYLIGNDFKNEKSQEEVEIGKLEVSGILADVAPTILELMELPQPPEMNGKSLLKILDKK